MKENQLYSVIKGGYALIVLHLLAVCPLCVGCRTDDVVLPSKENVGDGGSDNIRGFFLLNEGNMGSNKCTLDYYDYGKREYVRNIFGKANPDIVLELGDGGNDIGIYGSKLYAVINYSNLVEVMDAGTARHITQIGVPNCRNIAFDGKYAYVSSYSGARMDSPDRMLGYVARIDTASLTVVDTCLVGYQPEEMVVYENKLYVANSGGYCYPDYDRTVSIIDLNTFKVTKTLDVQVNLHRMEVDRKRGLIYVSSRGDYYSVPSSIYIIDAVRDVVADHIPDLPCADMVICGDSMYVYSTEWDNLTYTTVVRYSVYDMARRTIVPGEFVPDSIKGEIVYPYGISANPENGDVFVTDAKDFVTPGMLFCFGRDGNLKWKVMTGDLPGHFALTYHSLSLSD